MASRLVYVIGGQSGPQKIGISTDPGARLRAVQSHSPDAVLLHHQVLPDGDARLVERVAHQLLQAKRQHGEWFDVEIAEAIAAIGQAIELVEAGDLSALAKAPSGKPDAVMFRLPEFYLRMTSALAGMRGTDRNEVMRAALDAYFESYPELGAQVRRAMGLEAV